MNFKRNLLVRISIIVFLALSTLVGRTQSRADDWNWVVGRWYNPKSTTDLLLLSSSSRFSFFYHDLLLHRQDSVNGTWKWKRSGVSLFFDQKKGKKILPLRFDKRIGSFLVDDENQFILVKQEIRQ